MFADICSSLWRRNPTKGETPVPGPIMMMGREWSLGRWNGLETRGSTGICVEVSWMQSTLMKWIYLQLSHEVDTPPYLTPHEVDTTLFNLT